MARRTEILLIPVLLALMVQFLLMAAEQKLSVARARCADHLRGLRQASALYENDNGGSFPPVIGQGKGWERRWYYWPEYLRDYTENVLYFSCPEDLNGGREQLERQDDLLPHGFSLRYVSYGMNFLLGGNVSSNPNGRSQYLVQQVKNPGYLVFLGDSQTMELRPTSCWHKDYAPRHEGGANFLMVDGHVEWLNKETLGLGWQAQDGWKTDLKRWVDWK